MRRLRIGRSDTNDIVIPDASVSRQHAEVVELGGGRFSLKDLGSTFGTHVWLDQTWVPAADTEIRADTVIRFGEFRTTLFDVLSEADRAALGLVPPPSAPAPRPAAPPPSAEPPPPPPVAAPIPPPRPATPTPPEPPPIPREPSTPIEAPTPPRSAARPRRSEADRQRNAMRLGIAGVGSFFVLAIVGIILVLTLGDANPPEPRNDPRPDAAAEGQRNFLAACTTQWNVEERRCRCFLAAAGPNLERDDYDDFADMVEAYLSGDSDRSESVVQRVLEKRGVPASKRLSNAFKGLARDCP